MFKSHQDKLRWVMTHAWELIRKGWTKSQALSLAWKRAYYSERPDEQSHLTAAMIIGARKGLWVYGSDFDPKSVLP